MWPSGANLFSTRNFLVEVEVPLSSIALGIAKATYTLFFSVILRSARAFFNPEVYLGKASLFSTFGVHGLLIMTIFILFTPLTFFIVILLTPLHQFILFTPFTVLSLHYCIPSSTEITVSSPYHIICSWRIRLMSNNQYHSTCCHGKCVPPQTTDRILLSCHIVS